MEENIVRTKMGTMWGCLIWAVILIFGPIIFLAVKFYYDTEVKETPLVISHSPNDDHTIKVVEKGEPFLFGPSSIRLKYKNTDFQTSIDNDGKRVDASNVEIEWENDEKAVIMLLGEEQSPEIIRFEADDDDAVFKVDFIELGYMPTPSKYDPYGEYVIQIRKSTYSKGAEQLYNVNAPVRVYYGPKNSELTHYKEWKINDLSIWDTFELYWNDGSVLIDALGKNDNGSTYVKDSLEVPLQ